MLEHEREVPTGRKRRRAADDVPVAEGREQAYLPGEGRGGPGGGDREALNGDDGAREGVDGAEDLMRRRRRGIRGEGRSKKKNRKSQPVFSVARGKGKATQRRNSTRNAYSIFFLLL